jgi:NAD+ synthase
MVARVIETGLPLVYLNLLGGQDDQMFDGASFVLNPTGVLTHQMPAFEDGLFRSTFEKGDDGWRALPGDKAHLPDAWEADYRVMVLALRRLHGQDRVLQGRPRPVGRHRQRACRRHRRDALGPENVRCVMLPSRFTSDTSLEDARDVARNNSAAGSIPSPSAARTRPCSTPSAPSSKAPTPA